MKRELKKLLRPLVRQKANMHLTKSSNPLPVISSKVGGTPYAEHGETWPECQKCKRPLSFICQFDLREAGLGSMDELDLFTFFYCCNCMPCATSTGWVIRYYQNPDPAKAITISSGTQAHPVQECSVAFEKNLDLPAWNGLELWCPDAASLVGEASDKPVDYYLAVVYKMVGDLKSRSHVGGYPHWSQPDATPVGMQFLAQISSEDEAGIMWGDMGSAYLFMTWKPPYQFAVVWDCC